MSAVALTALADSQEALAKEQEALVASLPSLPSRLGDLLLAKMEKVTRIHTRMPLHACLPRMPPHAHADCIY